MSRTPVSSTYSPVITGTATVAADDALTLLSADDAFLAFFRASAAFGPGDSLRRLLPPAAFEGLESGDRAPAHWTRRVSFPDEGGPSLTHLSATRIDGMRHEGRYPVWHLVLVDLSGLAELRRNAALEKKKYDIIADATHDIPFEYDFASDTMSYAPKYRDIFGLEPVTPRFRQRLAAGESLGPVNDAFRPLFLDMAVPPDHAPECRAPVRNGDRHWFSLLCSRLEDETGTPVKAVGALRDIDRQKREQLRLLDKSRTDPLTGLLNKSATEEDIRKALHGIGPGVTHALMMLDVDNFKSVNDTLGHLAGDAVLVELAGQLRSAFRDADILGRVGGDEFHILMRGARDLRAVEDKAREVCASVRRHFLNHSIGSTISISVGVACTVRPVSYDELFRQADVALYRAKANGKNRYEFFGSDVRRDAAEGNGGTALSPASPGTRNGIAADIIDTLFSVRDLNQGIDKALDFIGNALNVGAVLIYEKSLDLKTISITHEWTARPEWSVRSRCQNRPVESVRLPRPAFPGGICYFNDLASLPPGERPFDKDPAVTSLLQCDVMRDGMVVGLISFEERGHKRIWTRQEIDALILLSKLISADMSLTRSAGLLRQSNEAARTILDSLPDAFVYVVSQATHRLLYFNSRVAEQFPHARPGMTCHRAFRNRDTPCEICATQQAGEENDGRYVLLRDTPFGKLARLSASSIVWENRESAFVALVSEHALSKEEREQQRKKEATIQALCDTYDYVLDIAPGRDSYELVALGEHFPGSFPPSGNYTAIHNAFADRHISPEDRENFRRNFAADALGAAFEAGAPAVEMEYRWQEEGVAPRWKHRVALPYRPADGSFHVLTYIRDISAQKQQELLHREEEADYLLALQSNYAEIFRIDLEKLRISPLYYNSRQVPISTGAMDLAEFVRQRAHTRVHPDYFDAVMAFYDPQAIARTMAEGESADAEYRKRQTENGEYRWIAATLRPVPGRPHSALLLLRDLTRIREDEASFYAALKNNFSEIYEMDLDEDRVRFISSDEEASRHGLALRYGSDIESMAATLIHPDDRDAFLAMYRPDQLRRRLERHDKLSLEYRRKYSDGVYHWISSLVLPLSGTDSCRVLVLVQDVSAQKELEKEHILDTQRFTVALRNTYDEIYEIDLEEDASTLLTSSHRLLPPLKTDENRKNQAIIDIAIHPDDRDEVLKTFSGASLLPRFTQGQTEVAAEFRRVSSDGGYRWVSGVAVPLRSENESCRKALLLLKDISERKRHEQQQRVAEQYDHALRNIYDELYELNVTRNAYRIMYHTPGKYVTPPDRGTVTEGVADVAEHMIHPDDKARFLAFFDLEAVRTAAAAGREFLIGEFRKLWMDGRYHWASLTMFPVERTGDGDEVYLVFIMDIDARKQAEDIARQKTALEEQRMADERYRIIVEQTGTMVFEWRRAGDARYLSSDLPERLAGDYDGRDMLRVWQEDEVVHPADRAAFEAFCQSAGTDARPEMTVRLRTRQGDFLWCKVAMACLRDEQGPYRIIGTINDVDAATRSIQALQYRAEYDTLTGVYNMQTFYDRASQLIRGHPERQYSILRMDIDRFKVINDLYGMEEGDRLLQSIAGILLENMSEHCVCGRLSGDIFCACVDYSPAEIEGFVRDMTQRLAAYPLTSKLVPSFGICRVDSPDTPINVLCDWASLALKTVKGNVLVYHAYYDETLRKRILDEKKIESEMHEALEQGQFRLYFQPKVFIPTSRIIGSEGLVRWVHPVEGLIPPDRFIPLFEKNGFILRLDEYVWEQACIRLRRWLDQGLSPTPVSVNVSRVHIHDTRLCEKLTKLIAKYRLPPHLLELELTESVFLDNDELLFNTIRTLQKHGFLFSLDDFGAGYSSLNMLKSLPIDIIKIDRGFLGEVVTTPRGKTVIRHTIAMARAMDMQIIAEGVETATQAAFLLDAGCTLAQGFHYSRPVPVADFERMAFGPSTPFPVDPEVLSLLK